MRDTKGEMTEDLVSEWRAHLLRHEAVSAPELEKLEAHLREEADSLQDAGLADDEAFLIALRRVGKTDSASREFARERFGQLWERPESAPEGDDAGFRFERTEFMVVIGLAIAAALAIKVPELFGYRLSEGDGIYVRNFSLFVLPMLAGYFAWKRRVSRWTFLWLILPFMAAGVFANIFPFKRDAHTVTLAALHLPLAMWLVVGFAYVGGHWRSVERRTDLVRFTGELFIYYVLIALGGGVFSLLTLVMFEAIDLDVSVFIVEWVLPCGAMGAVLVSAWLVERRQSIMQNLAPMLSRVFTPLFAAMLPVFLTAMVVTGEWVDMDRDMLIGFDIMLALVLGLLLFSISARDTQTRPGVFDALQLLLVVAAIAADLIALSAIVGRISEFGFSPNRTAALGGNLVLLGNLAWSAWLYLQFLRARGEFSALVRWQVNYLPVYAVWAGVVVVVFLPLFGYV